MRAYLWAIVSAFLLALVLGTGWYLIFGYDPYKSGLENLINIYKMPTFWIGIGIWSALYAMFFSLPMAFISRRRHGAQS